MTLQDAILLSGTKTPEFYIHTKFTNHIHTALSFYQIPSQVEKEFITIESNNICEIILINNMHKISTLSYYESTSGVNVYVHK